MPEWMMINSVEPSRYDAGTCYIAGTKYKTGDFTPYLYKTTDFGKTWQKITTGIASEHFTRVLREDPNKKRNALCRYRNRDVMCPLTMVQTGSRFQLNLPIVPITDLALKDNNLIVATQGRSLWIIDDLSVLYQLADAKGQGNYLFKPKDTYRMGGNSRKVSLTTGTNHPAGVMTYFNLDDPKDKEVKLSYLNSKNDTIKTFSTKK